MRTLPEVFDGIRQQERACDLEVVAVDSDSTDGTPEFLERQGAKLVRIPQADFNHGATRNLGIRHSHGDLVVLLVQDAVPVASDWLSHLIAPFANDSSIAGTFGRQQPHAGASVLTQWALSRWMAAGDTPRIVGPLTLAEWGALTPAARHDVCVFDNVCSCVRRSVWERHPFAHVTIAEDLGWARAVLLDGCRIAFVPTALVRHSHDRDPAYELRRTAQLHQRLFELFALSTVPTRRALARSIAATLASHTRVVHRDGAAAWIRALTMGVAWPVGQYLGARAGRRSAGEEQVLLPPKGGSHKTHTSRFVASAFRRKE